MRFHEYASRSEAAKALAAVIEDGLAAALEEKNSASFVVSGGSSPRQTYELLGRSTLAWDKVFILPSDERCVPRDSDRHNLAMVEATLGVEAAYIELGEASDIDALRPFDIALLGMGEDGHTASLFPDDPHLADALLSRGSTHRAQVPALEEDRISLTPSVLVDAKALVLLFFGAGKRKVFEAARKPGPVREYPVRILTSNAVLPLDVYWAP